MFGLLNVNKPVGLTSREVVNHILRALPRRTKAGHAGTLDPLATGVLVVCIGPATRLVPLIHQHSKSYLASFRLGFSSDTEDIEGNVQAVPVSDALRESDLAGLLPEFVGELEQVPPVYSAVKIQGERAHRVARRGSEVDLPPRKVQIHRIQLVRFDFPEFTLAVDCGTGTYIRSLGRDLARRLNTQAVMTHLVRTRIGPLQIDNAAPIEELDRNSLVSRLISPMTILNHLPQISLPDEAVKPFRCGRSIEFPEVLAARFHKPDSIAITAKDGRLVALATEKRGRLAPQIVFPLEQ